MNKDTFHRLASQGYTHIPLSREVLADLDTPLSTYLKLANSPYSYLFESMQGGEKWGRYSFIGLPGSKVIKVSGRRISIEGNGASETGFERDDPLAWIEEFRKSITVPVLKDMPRFSGGLVGYFGHDIVRYIEPRLGECPNRDDLRVPDILLMVSDELVVFDNLLGKLLLIVHAQPANAAGVDEAYDAAQARLDELEKRLGEPLSPAAITAASSRQVPIQESDFVSGFTEDGFKAAVQKAREYIIDGDIMQVVLSQRSSVPFDAPPLNLYRALRTLNPSPYMYYLNLGDFHVAGSSPEILARLEDGEVTVRPIAGTRRRGRDTAEDLAMEQELRNDPKELAEHLMLIDLGRNDVGRVSEIGSVRLTDSMVIERYSHVMHIVSNVTGRLRAGLGPIDVLRATFPAGTLSGAPKIRALEIIDELEPAKRSVYGGAVGYIDWSGNMDTAIAIRTGVIKDGVLYMQAGAGVVYDSVPELEWKETLNKSRAVFRAATMASADLRHSASDNS
ncbi:MAG TPA: anthranilate synthase component I [Gammaproteobacteria bacterium]|jgi:anthranilate synthase component 1